MSRVKLIWALFALSVAVAAAGLGYVSWVALRLDRSEAAARKRAAIQENVRLALWRMDSVLMPLMSQEGSRPYFSYSSFYPAERAYTRMYSPLQANDILVPSPLLAHDSPSVRLHFQVNPDGSAGSPQVPADNMRDLAEMGLRTTEQIEAAAQRLRELQQAVPLKELPGLLPEEPRAQQAAPNPFVRSPKNVAVGQQRFVKEAQQEIDRAEQQTRSEMAQSANIASDVFAAQKGKQIVMATSQPSDVREGALRPLWFGQTLVLARRVEADGKTYVQGCWLDWPVIRQNLLGAIRDLLPTAQLEPFSGSAAPKGVHLLATLPVRLVPGDVPVEENGGLSALELALLWAWAAALIVAVVIGVVLGQAVALSERRGAFVSAVTHELRTPLTTFRLYTELLAEGAVAAEDKRRQYLETLRREAERLGLLVENVLSYARLERNRHGTRIEAIALGTLFERVRPRLDDRAAQAQMRLELQLPQDAASWAVRTDPGAAEQILLNLVDNACKYAACADNKTILVRAARSGRLVTLLVRDYGPGVADTRRLFRPFSKSAREAAQSAPGVGLGLALSRRLARQMGGDLAWDQAVTDGAAFVLTLPAAAAAEKDPHRRQFSCDA